MREKAKKTYSNIKKMTSNLGKWVSENWIFYSRFRTAFIIISVWVFSLLLYLNLLSSIFVALFSLPFFFILDTRKLIVAKTNPEAFLKSEKIERWVEMSFVVFILSLFTFVVLVVALDEAGYGHLVHFLTSTSILVVYVGSGVGVALLLNLFEHSLSIIIGPLSDPKYKRLKLLSYFHVPPRISVRARICVLLDFLSKNSDIKAIRKKTGLFKEGLRIYNDYLGTKFDFVIGNPDKFYKYVRLTALSNDQKNIAKVKEDLTSLIKLMEQKEDDPFEFVRTIRVMMGESENKPCDLYRDIEIEPSTLRKQVTAHADLSKFLITVTLTLIGSVILPFVLKHL